MTTNEFFMLALGVIFLWELYAIIFVNRTIKLRGSVPFRGPVMVIAAVLFSGFYLFRWGVTRESIICVVMFIIVTLIFLVVRAGLTEHGVANNGNVMPYSRIQYYAFEKGMKGGTRVRLHSQRRELVLLFPDDQLPLFEAYMAKNEIPTMDAYRDEQKYEKGRKR